MDELLKKCAEKIFKDYIQSDEYTRRYIEMLNQDANMIKYNKMINDFLYQLRETDGFKKFSDIDEAITDQNCKIEKFGFINGFIFAANLLGK